MPTKTSRLTFRPVTLAEAQALGVEDLAEANYSEVELLQDQFPFKLHWGAYAMAERRGELVSIGAFCKGELVGYAAYTLYTPDHHMGTTWAFNRVIYMDKGRIGGMQAGYFSAECAPGKALDERLADSTWLMP